MSIDNEEKTQAINSLLGLENSLQKKFGQIANSNPENLGCNLNPERMNKILSNLEKTAKQSSETSKAVEVLVNKISGEENIEDDCCTKQEDYANGILGEIERMNDIIQNSLYDIISNLGRL